MSRRGSLAAPGAALFSLVVACASAAPSGTVLDCTAAGYDVLLVNPGPEAVESDRTVAWEVRFVRKSGLYRIADALEPGAGVFVSGALGSDYLSTPQPCTAVVK